MEYSIGKMLGTSARYCLRRQWCVVFTGNPLNDSSTTQTRSYAVKSKDPSKCCKDTPQTKGRQVVEWPGPDVSTPPWRCECPHDQTQPPNYDPYRIKVPEVVVPPLPPTNAKEKENPSEGGNKLFNFFKSSKKEEKTNREVQDLFQDSGIVHPDYWNEKQEPGSQGRDEPSGTPGGLPPRLSYHGKNKYKFAFHEPWKPLDRLSLLAEAEKQEQETADIQAAVKKYNQS